MSRDPVRDVVRGLTSLEMTFVNASGLWWTSHSPYVGQITYADTIFPCFAFLSGMSPTPVRRSLGLVGVGLGLNALVAVTHGKPVRIPGVLQRLGLASLIANAPESAFLRKTYGLPLVGLWYGVTLAGASETNRSNPLAHPDYAAADAAGTAQTRIDQLFFGSRIYKPSYDPEGLLGSLTTAVSMLVGQLFVEASDLDIWHKAAVALGAIATGETLHGLLPKYAPISKSLWTPSFVLVSSGVSILKYLAVEAGLPYLPAGVQGLLQAVGRRSLEVYIVSTILTVLLGMAKRQPTGAKSLSWLESVVGSGVADFLTTSTLTAIVAASAKLMVSQGWKLQW
ncbi:hypothetical protein GQ53DRAFT_745795 [Thozetella sp. PMI_491]|nr:hypothetical protein GQ53DRAFT_745795 [Thozetella sp. PMI_491]